MRIDQPFITPRRSHPRLSLSLWLFKLGCADATALGGRLQSLVDSQEGSALLNGQVYAARIE